MRNNVIMRCGTNFVTLAMFNNEGTFTDALSFPIHYKNSDDESWLQALSSAIDKIPKNLRENIVLVMPPNSKVFVKYIDIPKVDQAKYDQALQFEFKRNFPGEPTEWVWDAYKCGEKNDITFILAIQRSFAEQLLDILLRKKINLSYLCPEILLNQIALKKYSNKDKNIVMLHVGSEVSLISINSKNIQYMRVMQLAADWVDGQIATSQQISVQDAKRIKQEHIKNRDGNINGLTFIAYYIRQFAQKIQQELKRSELFFYRTFNQATVNEIIVSGEYSLIENFCDVIKSSNTGATVEHSSKVIENVFSKSLSNSKVQILSNNLFAYCGAIECIIKNETKLISLFSDDFRNQITFQRRHPSYMAATIIVIFSTILGLKLIKQKNCLFKSQKLALEAKLRETIVDSQKYNETISSESRLRDSIVNIKKSLYSQETWISLFDHLQKSMAILETAWIDSMTWKDLSDQKINDTIHIVAKIFIKDDKKSEAIAKDIERFLLFLKKSSDIVETTNTVVSPIENAALKFSFDVKLDNNSQVFAQ